MNYKGVGYLIFIVFFTLLALGTAQGESTRRGVPSRVQSLTMERGLFHNGINSMMRDSKGYLWLSTYNGVSRYNGVSVLNIKNDENSDILCSNRVRTMIEDSCSNLWIGTELGVTFLDRELGKYSFLPLPRCESERQYVVSKLIYSKSQGKVYGVCENYGILVYNLSGELLKWLELPVSVAINDALFLEDSSLLLLATTKGIMQCDLQKIVALDFMVNQEVSTIIRADGDNRLLIAPLRGFCEVEYKISQNNRAEIVEVSQMYLSGQSVHTMLLDGDGALWVGSNFDGVSYLDDYHKSDRQSVKLLENSRISGFMMQSNGSVWCLTYDDGAVEFAKNYGDFFDLSSKLGSVDLRFSKFVKLGGDRLLIRTFGGEYYLYNYIDNCSEEIDIDEDSLGDRVAKTLIESKDGGVWIVYDNGSLRRVTASGDVQAVESTSLRLLDGALPVSYAEDQIGDLWLGYQAGLYRVRKDEAGYRVVESLADNRSFAGGVVPKIRVIYPDPAVKDVVWIGTTTSGLFKIECNGDLKDAKVINYLNDLGNSGSLPRNFVSAILRHRSGDLIVGTEEGGVAVMHQEGEFKRYSQGEGLSNSVVKSIEEDLQGRLWIATNYGLNCLELESGVISKYFKSDGLVFDEFRYESDMLSSGELVFSGTGGVMLFDPAKLSDHQDLPNVEFSGLRLMGDEVRIGETIQGRILLPRELENGGNLVLNYNENILSVGIDLLGDKPLKNYTLYYQLLPLSEQYIEIKPSQEAITLSGLGAGEYELRVRAANSFGEFTEAKLLQIEIKPPFWASWWAVVLYIFLTIGIIYVVLSVILHIISLRFAKKNLEQLNRDKQIYFSNIAHELKTPLSLIIAPIDALSQRFRFDIDITSKVDIVKHQSRRMLQLIDSTHCLHLDDMDMLSLSQTCFDFDAFLGEIVDDFKFSAQYAGKNFEVELLSGTYVMADRAMLEMALSNILNNAFKYTQKEDTIYVGYRVRGSGLEIEISDTGVGVSLEDQPYIFDRYYQGSQALKRSGSGIGLSFTRRIIELHNGDIKLQSELGEGSKFIISLPILTSVKECGEVGLMEEIEQNNQQGSIILDLPDEVKPLGSKWQDSMIFVVEDNAVMCRMIEEALIPYFRVKSFSGGDECLSEMQRIWPNLVVSDVRMEQGDGYELCAKIKSELATSHIPVILLTGCSSLDDKMRGFDSGADDYINKPFYTSHLISRIEHLLKNRENLRHRFEVGIPLEMGENRIAVKVENEFLVRLYDFFEQNIENEDIDMDYVASQFIMSRSSLYQKIKTLTNSTPFELLKAYRLKRAAQLLEEGMMNVTEVVDAVGFKNRTHFVKVFKEKYDMSPSQYAKAARGKS